MPKSKRIYTKSRQSARLLNRNRENMTVPMKHNIWTCCNGTDPVRHAKTTSWTYRRRGRIPVMDSSSEPMAQARTVLGIQPVPAIHFDAKRKEQVERLKNLLLNSPDQEEYTRRLAPLFETWVSRTKGYEYKLYESAEDQDDDYDDDDVNLCWTRDDDNLSCLMKHKKIVEVREEHFPDPVRFLETLREEWPTDLPAYLQQVVIDAMPLKGEPYLCQMCGMRLPRERVEQVGYSNGSCFRVAVSLTCGIFADSNRMCTACSSQVFTRFLDVQEILYKTQMEDYDRLQREEEEETEGLQEYELGEPSDPDYITYMYASEVVVIDDSEREVIVID